VLRYLPTNLSTPEIAAELYLSTNTIKTHQRHLYQKLGAGSRTEAVERARALGLLAPSSRRPASTRSASAGARLALRARLQVAGQDPPELAAGADAQLSEHLAQVVLDRPGGQEQPGADLRVGQAVAGQPGDLGLLDG
jgi:hypothetical protein